MARNGTKDYLIFLAKSDPRVREGLIRSLPTSQNRQSMAFFFLFFFFHFETSGTGIQPQILGMKNEVNNDIILSYQQQPALCRRNWEESAKKDMYGQLIGRKGSTKLDSIRCQKTIKSICTEHDKLSENKPHKYFL